MPLFSQKSLERLNTCDHHLVILFNEVVKHRDCSVLCGHRGKEDQDEAVKSGSSTKPWPTGKHNSKASEAVDIAPYINGHVSYDREQCIAFAGFVLGMAAAMGMQNRIRWGGDWDNDQDIIEHRLQDLVHFEIIARQP